MGVRGRRPVPPAIVPALVILAALGLPLLLLGGGRAFAQSEETVAWEEPQNLSQSRVAYDPHLLWDSDGALHALWQERGANFLYAQQEEEGWTSPEPVVVPFTDTSPSLYTDLQGRIQAFWRSDEEELLYSRAPLGTRTLTAWSEVQALAGPVADLDLAVDRLGGLHLSYIQTVDGVAGPAGLYYRRSGDGGATWSAPLLLYASAYFRSLTPPDSALQIIATETDRILVAWDLRRADAVLLVRSPDGGRTWEAVVEVDRRREEDLASTAGPAGLRVAAAADEIHLLWQRGVAGSRCALVHQVSKSGGATWETAQSFDPTETCPAEHWLMAGSDGDVYLMIDADPSILLAAWDGVRWSEWQSQPPLSTIVNPATFRTVQLGCLQPLSLPTADSLVVLACESTESGDIWLTRRSMEERSSWFAPPPAWTAPSVVFTSTESVVAPVLLAESDRIHLFWSRPGLNAIQYSQQTSEGWLQPVPALSSPTEAAGEAAVATMDGRLFALWTDPDAGQLYLSHTAAEGAWDPSEWLTPSSLPVPGAAVGGPNIVFGDADTLFVAMAVPVNEQRGIYVTRSTDGGATWAQPVRVFDGAAAGWPFVARPRMTRSEDGTLHLLWMRSTLSAAATGDLLLYARSEDEGQSWSTPEVVADALIGWSDLIATGDHVLHRLWLDDSGRGYILRHQLSLDSGRNWSRAASAGGALPGAGIAAVADRAGRLHVLRAQEEEVGHRMWDQRGWRPEENVPLPLQRVRSPGTIRAAIGADGGLSVVSIRPVPDDDGGTYEEVLYTQRALSYPSEVPTPLPTPTPRTPAEPTVTPAATAVVSPTPTLPRGLEEGSGGPTRDVLPTSSALLLTILLTGLLVSLVAVVRVRSIRAASG